MTPERSTRSELPERFRLRVFAEACLALEEGVAAAKDIDIAMAAGAGMPPGPFAAADAEGLDTLLAALQRAEEAWGQAFSPPLVLLRLVNQGRLGKKAGQGFYPYPGADAGKDGPAVLLEWRGPVAVAWLNRPPANALGRALAEDLAAVWAEVDGKARALVLASTTPAIFCAGADIKEFGQMDPAGGGAEAIDRMHALMRSMERSSTVTIASVNSLTLGGGCELAMACDLRIAAESAIFGQPEIALGIIPGFGGTQRLPRLVGEGKALEMNLLGSPIGAYEALRIGLVNQVVPDHELFDVSLGWARRLAAQAPLAVSAIKRVSSGGGDLDAGLAREKEAFGAVFGSEDAREGVAAFVAKRRAVFKGS